MGLEEQHQEWRSLDPDPVHTWFELSYAQYLTIPRSALQSMPAEWQQRFVQCLEELDEAIDWRPEEGCYKVELRELEQVWSEGSYEYEWGDQIDDPLADYQRGRRRLPVKE